MMDFINITICPTDEEILKCFDYRICKHMLHNDCIYADRCNMLHDNVLKIQRGDKDNEN